MMAIASSLRSQRNDKLSRRSKYPVEEDASENNVFIKKYLDGSSNNGDEPEGSECSLTEASSFGNSATSLGASLSEFSTGPLIREVPPVRIDKTHKRNRGLYRSRSSRLSRESQQQQSRRGVNRSASGRSLSDAHKHSTSPSKLQRSKKKTDELGSTSAHVVSGNTNKHVPSESSYTKKNQEIPLTPSTKIVTPSPPINRRVQRSYSTQSFLADRSPNTPSPVRKPMKKNKSDDLREFVTGATTIKSGRRRIAPLEIDNKDTTTEALPASLEASPKKKRSDRKKKQMQKQKEENHTPFVSPRESPRSQTRLSRATSTRNVAGEAKSKGGGFLMEPPSRPSRAAAAAIMAPGKKSQLVRPTRSMSPPMATEPPSAREELKDRILRRTKSLQELGERTEETYYTILKEHNDSAHVEREVRESSDYGNQKVVIKLKKDRLTSPKKKKSTKAPPSRAAGMSSLNHFLNTSDKALQAYDEILKETNDSARAEDRLVASSSSSRDKGRKFSDMTI